MKTDIQIYEHEQLGTVRCWRTQNGKVLFLASDVAKGLGYRDAYTMTRSLDDDEKDTQIVCTPGGEQEMTVITQSGFLHAALKSRVEKAKEFRRWVTDVVLPQIMSTGGYIPMGQQTTDNGQQTRDNGQQTTDNGQLSDAEILSRALMIAQKTIELKNSLLEEQKPKVLFADAVADTDDSILIRQLAKLITQNGYEIGERRLFVWLKANGYLFKKDNDNSPRQEWVERGIFTTTVSLIQTNHGVIERITTRVTGKGQKYFVNGFLTGSFKAGNKELAEMM